MEPVYFVAIFCAFFVKGLAGFANTLVLNTILSFSKATVEITPVDLMIGLPSNIYIAWKERAGISLKVTGPLTLLVFVGLIPGTLLLKNSDDRVLKLLLGVLIIALGVEMLLRLRQSEVSKQNPVVVNLIGLVSGVLSGMFGIGAFLAAYISRTTETHSAFKGNLCAVFLSENLFRVILYSWAGILTTNILGKSLLLLPVMFAGLVCGLAASKRLSELQVKRVVVALLLVSGVSVLLTNL